MTLEALLLFGSALGTGALLRLGWLEPMIIASGRGLLIDSILLVSSLVFLLLLWRQRPNHRVLFWFVVGVFALVHVILLTHQFSHRFPFNQAAFVHDGAVQVEEAARLLHGGQNPYAADFQSTRFGAFQDVRGPAFENKAWTHLVYPPASILLALPVVWMQDLGVEVDMSLITILAVWASFFFLVQPLTNWQHRTRLALLTIGNPLVWFFALAGFNDVLFVFAIVAALWFSYKRKFWMAGISMGVATALKQTAWPIALLWVLWLWFRRKRELHAVPQLKAFFLTAGILYAPFLLWGPNDLVADLVTFPSGSIPNAFPIAGSTLLQYLHVWQIVPSAWATFPAWILQAIVAIGIGGFGLRWLLQKPHQANFLLVAVPLLIGIMLVSRFVFENYLQAVLLLVIAGYAATLTNQESSRE